MPITPASSFPPTPPSRVPQSDHFGDCADLVEYITDHGVDPDRALRYMVMHDFAGLLLGQLLRPAHEGGLGVERAVGHGSWVLPMTVRDGREWLGGLDVPDLPRISKAHLTSRLPRDIDLFFPDVVQASKHYDHADTVIEAINSLIDRDDGVGLGGLVRYVSDRPPLPTGTGRPAAWSELLPQQVWARVRAEPTDPGMKPISFWVDVHPPDKTPLIPDSLQRPARGPRAVEIPGFVPVERHSFPIYSEALWIPRPSHAFMAYTHILTQNPRSQVQPSDDPWAAYTRRIFDAYYLLRSMGEVGPGGDVNPVIFESEWRTHNPYFHQLAPFQIDSSDSCESAYEAWKDQDTNLLVYPPFRQTVTELETFVNGVRNRRALSTFDPARAKWVDHPVLEWRPGDPASPQSGASDGLPLANAATDRRRQPRSGSRGRGLTP